MVPGITRKESIPGTRWNAILAELLFVDNVHIERRHLPRLNLSIINKQLHSFSPPPSSTTPTNLAHHHHQWPPPTMMHSTDTAHNKYSMPQKSKNDPATPHHHPELANEHLELMSVAKPQKAFATRRPGEAVPWGLGECWQSRRMKKFEFLSFSNKVKSC